MNKKKVILFTVMAISLTGCLSTPSDYASARLPASAEGSKIAIVKSVYPTPENLPDTLSVSRANVILEEELIMSGNCQIGSLDADVAEYEEIAARIELQKRIFDETGINYLATLKIMSYDKPSVKFFIGAASSSGQAYQLKMQLRILDLETGMEYVAETVSETSQRTNAVALKQDRSRTIGEESAVGVALEKGITRLVYLLF